MTRIEADIWSAFASAHTDTYTFQQSQTQTQTQTALSSIARSLHRFGIDQKTNKATHESVRLLEHGDWRGCLVGVCVVWAQLVCYSLDCACCVYHKGSGVSRSTLPASLFEHPSIGQAFGLLTKITHKTVPVRDGRTLLSV